MKVAWITAVSINNNDGGVENSRKNLKTSGGWIISMLSALNKKTSNYQFHVISINESNRDCVFDDGSIKFYCIKGKPTSLNPSKKIKKTVIKYIDLINPELIDVQGIEFCFSNIKFGRYNVCYTIQGLPFELFKYQRMQNLGVNSLINQSFKSVLTLKNFYSQNFYMKIRGQNAKKLLMAATNVLGRTDWDFAISTFLNPNVNYYPVNRVLREPFYSKKWNVGNLSKHVLFSINFSTINKGADTILRAISLVKKRFLDIKLLVPGSLNDSSFSGKWYDRYLKRLIKKLKITDNIVFLGNLNAEKMADYLSNSSLFISPSLNENSSNSIAEAQIVGIPVIATLTGGNSTYIENKETGYLYNQWDEFMCAKIICDLLDSEDICKSLSEKEQRISKLRHREDIAVEDLIKAYEAIIRRS